MLNPEIVKICEWCEEPVLAHEAADDEGGAMFHVECRIRMVVGSLAHVEGRCSCYVPASTEHEPEGLTRREAARAAVNAWRLLDGQHRYQVRDAQQDHRDP